MLDSRYGYRTPVPNISAKRQQTKSLSYQNGVNTYKDNDDVKMTELVRAIDARMVKIGRYKTRKGCDPLSVPLGEAVWASQTATTSQADQTVNGSQALAQKLTAATSGRLTRVDVNIKSTATSSGVVIVEVRTDQSGAPGTVIATSSLKAADITSSYGYLDAHFIEAPQITASSSYWVVIRGQSSNMGDFLVSSTTAGTNAQTSGDNGSTWTAAAFDLNVKLYTATDGAVKGVFRAYTGSGPGVTLFAAGDSVYKVDEVTGTATAIKTGLNAAATTYRFALMRGKVYWVNGYDKPQQYDFSTVTEVTDCPIIPLNLISHVGLMWYMDTANKNHFVYSNFDLPTTFTSTDFGNVPSAQASDPLTAWASLNGVLVFFSRTNKYQVFGSDNATFQTSDATDTRGAFSQDAVVQVGSYIYHADDEGVYQFNGTQSKNLAESFLADYQSIPNKDSIVLDVFNNRLYIYFTPTGEARNSECWVYNLLLGVLESKDTGTYVSHTFGRDNQDGNFIVASNKVAAIYYQEKDSNDFNNLGAPLEFELATAYQHFDSPGQLKRVTKWRPVFSSVSGDYSVQVGYAKDMAADTSFQDVSLAGSGARWGSFTWDSGIKWASSSNVEPGDLYIPGDFKRVQRIYKHVAAREPVEFDSEVLELQTQRLR